MIITTQRQLDDSIALSATTVRTLYSLQLELDTVLSAKVSGQCRVWAEER